MLLNAEEAELLCVDNLDQPTQRMWDKMWAELGNAPRRDISTDSSQRDDTNRLVGLIFQKEQNSEEFLKTRTFILSIYERKNITRWEMTVKLQTYYCFPLSFYLLSICSNLHYNLWCCHRLTQQDLKYISVKKHVRKPRLCSLRSKEWDLCQVSW